MSMSSEWIEATYERERCFVRQNEQGLWTVKQSRDSPDSSSLPICQGCWKDDREISTPLRACPNYICKEQPCSIERCRCTPHEVEHKRAKYRLRSTSQIVDLNPETQQSSGIRKPRKIILVRHEQSLGNIEETAYETIPDWLIPITEEGMLHGVETGKKVKELVGDMPVYIYTSPYQRTKHTCSLIVEQLDDHQLIGIREEPRLIEQQFGNFQKQDLITQSKKERAQYGSFFYRFPNGESGLDVYNRITDFISTLFRDFKNPYIAREDFSLVFVTHGLTMRLFLMRWFQYSVEEFERTRNPPNGGIVIMERKNNVRGEEWYELTPPSLNMLKYPMAAKPYRESLPQSNTGRKKSALDTLVDEGKANTNVDTSY